MYMEIFLVHGWFPSVAILKLSKASSLKFSEDHISIIQRLKKIKLENPTEMSSFGTNCEILVALGSISIPINLKYMDTLRGYWWGGCKDISLWERKRLMVKPMPWERSLILMKLVSFRCRYLWVLTFWRREYEPQGMKLWGSKNTTLGTNTTRNLTGQLF